jgi:hypothetical protein
MTLKTFTTNKHSVAVGTTNRQARPDEGLVTVPGDSTNVRTRMYVP